MKFAEDYSTDVMIAFGEADRSVATQLAAALHARGLRVSIGGEASGPPRIGRDQLRDPSTTDAVFLIILLSPALRADLQSSLDDILQLSGGWDDYALPVILETERITARTTRVVLDVSEFGIDGIANLCRRRYHASQQSVPVMMNVADFASCEMERFERTLTPYVTADAEFIRNALPIRFRMPAALREYLDQLHRAVEQGTWDGPVSQEALMHASRFLTSIDGEIGPRIVRGIRALLYGVVSLELSLADVLTAIRVFVLAETVGIARQAAMYLFEPRPPGWVGELREAGIPRQEPAPSGLPWAVKALGRPVTLWVDGDLSEPDSSGRSARVYLPDCMLLDADEHRISKQDMHEILAPQLVRAYARDPAGDLHLQYALAYFDRFVFSIRGEWVVSGNGYGPVSTKGSGEEVLGPLRRLLERRVDDYVSLELPKAPKSRRALRAMALRRRFRFLLESGS